MRVILSTGGIITQENKSSRNGTKVEILVSSDNSELAKAALVALDICK